MTAPIRSRPPFDYYKSLREDNEDWMLDALKRGQPIEGAWLARYLQLVDQIPEGLREHIADRLARPRREVGRKGSSKRAETELDGFRRSCLVRWYDLYIDEYGNSDTAFQRLAKDLRISEAIARRYWAEAPADAKRLHRELDHDRRLDRKLAKKRRRST